VIETFLCAHCDKEFTARADSAVVGQKPRCPACAAAARALFRQQMMAQKQQHQQAPQQ
jgi:DNA-directed RNA polymerase subunit RPC12/RpoP